MPRTPSPSRSDRPNWPWWVAGTWSSARAGAARDTRTTRASHRIAATLPLLRGALIELVHGEQHLLELVTVEPQAVLRAAIDLDVAEAQGLHRVNTNKTNKPNTQNIAG